MAGRHGLAPGVEALDPDEEWPPPGAIALRSLSLTLVSYAGVIVTWGYCRLYLFSQVTLQGDTTGVCMCSLLLGCGKSRLPADLEHPRQPDAAVSETRLRHPALHLAPTTCLLVRKGWPLLHPLFFCLPLPPPCSETTALSGSPLRQRRGIPHLCVPNFCGTCLGRYALFLVMLYKYRTKGRISDISETAAAYPAGHEFNTVDPGAGQALATKAD